VPVSNAYLAWKSLCKKYGWSGDQDRRNENENFRQEAKKGQEKLVSKNFQGKNKSPEDGTKPIIDKEMPNISKYDH